jgi:hypothetical protein
LASANGLRLAEFAEHPGAEQRSHAAASSCPSSPASYSITTTLAAPRPTKPGARAYRQTRPARRLQRIADTAERSTERSRRRDQSYGLEL